MNPSKFSLDFLPREKFTDRQLRLFDPPMPNKGAARAFTGYFFEEALSVLTGAKRMVTNSNCSYCPDHRLDEKNFYECKAVGKSGQCIFYRNRFNKDLAFVNDTGITLTYWLWRHTYGVTAAETVGDLFRGLAACCSCVYEISQAHLAKLLAGRECRTVNSGYTKSGKRLGYGKNG